MDQWEDIRILGKLPRDVREAAGMSRKELAEKVGCKYDDIRVYEKGERVMRIDRLFRVLDVLDIHIPERLCDVNVYKATVKWMTLDHDRRRILLDEILSMIEAEQETRERR